MDCLIVTDKPEITAHPQGVAKTEGDNVTLSCNATANPVATISWTRDGSPVDTGGNSPRISFSNDIKQLTITNVHRKDSGEYRCVARNSLGNDTSNAASLDVQCKLGVCFQCGITMLICVGLWLQLSNAFSAEINCLRRFVETRERVVLAASHRYFSA